MKKLLFYLVPSFLAVLTAMLIRFLKIEPSSYVLTSVYGLAFVAIGFMLTWAAEVTKNFISHGITVAILGLIVVLPEYAVDIYYSYMAGLHPEGKYTQLATANMTGSNRLLIGIGWSLIGLLYWIHNKKKAVKLKKANSVELIFLALATLYSFVIILKKTISLLDMGVLFGLYAAYIYRLNKYKKEEGEEEEIGPAKIIVEQSKNKQIWIIILLGITAIAGLLSLAEPFSESLVTTGKALGINRYLIVQWLAPIASESPEIIIAIMFVINGRPETSLGTLITSKVNQWTLLIGMIPLAFSIAAGKIAALPLSEMQGQQLFLTSAQSVFAVSLILNRKLHVRDSIILMILFLTQLVLGFIYQHDNAMSLKILNYGSWVYLAFGIIAMVKHQKRILPIFKKGLWKSN
ncbi:sodium:proton exchanger [Christiangramia fulva]|uniref:Sodium:proton exchanger n=1 Tax=Christiangramia fulva TaxID=2126553 RepID=A0A2R3Z3Z8_9FLAO|nr:sodium:proton exchanger [Christiangramia fulva]AVR44958.1 sodium:proton exchanger [Christiangramia fulva]